MRVGRLPQSRLRPFTMYFCDAAGREMRSIVANKIMEQMPYRGESPQDRHAFAEYMNDVNRGKSLLALIAMRKALTPEIRKNWYEGTFTPIETTQGSFDELTCNLAYHFGKHGANLATLQR